MLSNIRLSRLIYVVPVLHCSQSANWVAKCSLYNYYIFSVDLIDILDIYSIMSVKFKNFQIVINRFNLKSQGKITTMYYIISVN